MLEAHTRLLRVRNRLLQGPATLEELAAEAWGPRPPKTWRAAAYRMISELRKGLPEGQRIEIVSLYEIKDEKAGAERRR